MSTTANKKRKETDGASIKTKDEQFLEVQPSVLELLKENEEKDKRIEELEELVKELKEKLGEEDGDDELSDDEQELDSSNPWDSKFIQLREYRMVNGHCSVPRKVPGLGSWVDNQKSAFKKGNLSQERIILMEGIGFNWGKSCPQPFTFEEGLEELKKFKKAMGHCNIFVDPKSPSKIAKWCQVQRNEYKRLRKNKDSLLTLDQVGQLKELGFKWKAPKRG